MLSPQATPASWPLLLVPQILVTLTTAVLSHYTSVAGLAFAAKNLIEAMIARDRVWTGVHLALLQDRRGPDSDAHMPALSKLIVSTSPTVCAAWFGRLSAAVGSFIL